MLPEFYEFHNPTRVVYGAGIASDFQAELEAIGKRKYYLVSDKVISELGLVQQVVAGLTSAGIEVTGEFNDVPPNSELKTVRTCAEQADRTGAEGLIAIGGGSVIDTAKGANILFSEGGDLVEDYSGAQTLTRPLNPLIAIPTTAGTGSEATIIAVIYDEENKEKLSFADKFLLPDLAVLDPVMTASMPPGLTAATAMDALTHAVEAYVGMQWSPVSDMLAAGAVQHVFNSIIKAVENGDDLEARGELLVASNMAGMAFSHSMVGCVHGMAHGAGALYHVPHGVANGILLPHGLAYNFDQVKEKLAKLAPFMGIEASGMSVKAVAELVITAIRNLTGALNRLGALPLRLRDAGVPQEGLQAIAEYAVNDGTSWYNPREVVAEEIVVHLENAY